MEELLMNFNYEHKIKSVKNKQGKKVFIIKICFLNIDKPHHDDVNFCWCIIDELGAHINIQIKAQKKSKLIYCQVLFK